MTAWLDDGDVRIYLGDVRDQLAHLPDGSVDCVITSPPYWGLRDYGTGSWVGGDPACDHLGAPFRTKAKLNENWGAGFADVKNAEGREPMREVCSKCGARRVDQQLGLEPTPDAYVQNMVAVFREVRRVLADHGTLWLNLGDSYATGGNGVTVTETDREAAAQRKVGYQEQGRSTGQHGGWENRASQGKGTAVGGLKPKDLCGVPWRVAFALQQPYYAGRIKDERDRIWLAATVEAEGCLFIHKRKVGQSNGQGYVRKTASYGAGLEVASTDRVIVERCMAITGIGSICEQTPEQNTRRKQTIYRWNVRSNECRWIIEELYPHFYAKQHEARLLISCPSSGADAERAHTSLKALHNGQQPDIDFAPPKPLWEPGWFLRSDVIWAKPQPNAGERVGQADEGA